MLKRGRTLLARIFVLSCSLYNSYNSVLLFNGKIYVATYFVYSNGLYIRGKYLDFELEKREPKLEKVFKD